MSLMLLVVAGYFVSASRDFTIWFDFIFRAKARNAHLLKKFWDFFERRSTAVPPLL